MKIYNFTFRISLMVFYLNSYQLNSQNAIIIPKISLEAEKLKAKIDSSSKFIYYNKNFNSIISEKFKLAHTNSNDFYWSNLVSFLADNKETKLAVNFKLLDFNKSLDISLGFYGESDGDFIDLFSKGSGRSKQGVRLNFNKLTNSRTIYFDELQKDSLKKEINKAIESERVNLNNANKQILIKEEESFNKKLVNFKQELEDCDIYIKYYISKNEDSSINLSRINYKKLVDSIAKYKKQLAEIRMFYSENQMSKHYDSIAEATELSSVTNKVNSYKINWFTGSTILERMAVNVYDSVLYSNLGLSSLEHNRFKYGFSLFFNRLQRNKSYSNYFFTAGLSIQNYYDLENIKLETFKKEKIIGQGLSNFEEFKAIDTNGIKDFSTSHHKISLQVTTIYFHKPTSIVGLEGHFKLDISNKIHPFYSARLGLVFLTSKNNISFGNNFGLFVKLTDKKAGESLRWNDLSFGIRTTLILGKLLGKE